MYSYNFDVVEGEYEILDPDGDILARVSSLGEAETLLSHLNR